MTSEELNRALYPKLLPFYMNKAISTMYQPFYSMVDNSLNTLNSFNEIYNNYLNKMVQQSKN